MGCLNDSDARLARHSFVEPHNSLAVRQETLLGAVQKDVIGVQQNHVSARADIDAYLAKDPEAASGFAPNARGRWQADLYALARASLAAAGVAEVYGGEFCTFGEDERFFSHRREAPCGRIATLIWLERGS